MNLRELKEPVQVTWNDIILSIYEGEERGYEPQYHGAIRNAISRNLKYSNPDRLFTTRFGVNDEGERKFYVRRLTQEEITQQQRPVVGAGQ